MVNVRNSNIWKVQFPVDSADSDCKRPLQNPYICSISRNDPFNMKVLSGVTQPIYCLLCSKSA